MSLQNEICTRSVNFDTQKIKEESRRCFWFEQKLSQKFGDNLSLMIVITHILIPE